MKENLLWIVVISATGRRNASRTLMGMPPFCCASYCDKSWGRLPSTMADVTAPDDGTKVLLREQVTVDFSILPNSFIVFH